MVAWNIAGLTLSGGGGGIEKYTVSGIFWKRSIGQDRFFRARNHRSDAAHLAYWSHCSDLCCCRSSATPACSRFSGGCPDRTWCWSHCPDLEPVASSSTFNRAARARVSYTKWHTRLSVRTAGRDKNAGADCHHGEINITCVYVRVCDSTAQ